MEDRPDPFDVRPCLPDAVCFTPPLPGENRLTPMGAVRLGERLIRAGRQVLARREEEVPE